MYSLPLVLDGPTGFPSDHVRCDVIWQHDALVDEVRDRFHTEATCLIGGEKDEQEPSNEANGPRY